MSTILTETEGFTPVIDVLAEELGLMTAVVYGIVWRYCQMRNKVCSASRETIAKHANISVKTVDRHLDKLCRAGYLKDLHPDWKHRPHIYADTGKLKIEALVRVGKGETESPTSEEGETESPTTETQSPTGETESLTGETESPTKIPSYDSTYDSQSGEKEPDFPENPKERTDAIQPGPQDATAPDGPDNERSEAGNHQDSAGAILYSEGRGYPGLSLSDDRRDHEPAGERPDPTRLDLDRATLAKREELGGNPAVPPPAGGSDAVAHAGIVALAKVKGSRPPKTGSGGYIQQLEKFGEPLRDQGEQDPEVAALASQMLWDEKPTMANPYYSSFRGDYGDYLGRAREKLDKRRTSPPPPADYEPVYGADPELLELETNGDCPVGKAVKDDLALQMRRGTFDVYVRPTAFVQEDGILRVTAPIAFVKDWLENRLATTIQRTAVGVAGGAVEVEFEVEEVLNG